MKFDEPDFSEEDDEKVIAKYKALLTGAEDQAFKDDVNEDSEASDGAMEMTYVPEAEKNTAAEEKALEDMTPWEKYLNKKKEKNKKKKEKKQSLKESDEINEENEEDNEEVPSDVDLNDPFFKEELSSLKSTKKDDKISKGTIHILRKHLYSTKLNLISLFFTKTGVFHQNKRIYFSTLRFEHAVV